MGGHAFKSLYCPRMSREIYLEVRDKTTEALRELFKRVVVPAEMPSKKDYGDVDFLVAGFLNTAPDAALDWTRMVADVKEALHTVHGRRGHLTPQNMYFAVRAPGHEEVWVQIDVKVHEATSHTSFEWASFQLHYASGLKMMASLAKPLGVTIDPTGLHIRVEELEATNFPGSLVFVSKEPTAVLKILGLDKRFLYGGLKSNEEVYKYFASSRMFNPAHFQARLQEEKYRDDLYNRSAAWVNFVTEWIPEQYPDYHKAGQDLSLEEWRKQWRAALREKVFTLFPAVTFEYYTKRSLHLKEVEEHRLQRLLTNAIPAGEDGWSENIPHPRIVVIQNPIPTSDANSVSQDTHPAINGKPIATEHPPTPPYTPPSSVKSGDLGPNLSQQHLLSTPLHLEALSRSPPLPFLAKPPPHNMSAEAKLLCLFRWTHFDSQTGNPYLGCAPREKKSEMLWSSSGASDQVLVEWVQAVWWGVWVRQAWVNYVGMWKRRFEKEDAKAEKARMQNERADMEKIETEAKEAKIRARLDAVNKL